MLQGMPSRKIPVFLILLIVSFAVFTLPHVFSNTASAPYADGDFIGDHFIAPDTSVPQAGFPNELTPELPVEPGADPAAEPELTVTHDDLSTEPDAPADNDFITVKMDIADISHGSLLLINNDHRFDIPDEPGFIAINESKASSYRVTSDRMMISPLAIEPLNDMMDAFHDETGISSVTVISAFRDYEKQQETLNDYIKLVGRAEAPKWASLPGHSEHQAGLAVDFGLYSGGALRTFTGTGVYAWFKENSYKYGYILRFPDDKSEITETAHEAWHFRYVGEPHAYLMHENNWCLEEYVELLREYTPSETYSVTYDDRDYEIFYTSDTEIPIPFDCEFDISGNNVDGFIVTLAF